MITRQVMGSLLAGFILTVFLAGCGGPAPLSPERKTQITEAILNTYTSRAAALSLQKQGHFYLRLYRLRSDSAFLPPIQAYADSLKETFIRHAEQLNDPAYRESKTRELTQLPEDAAAKKIKRARVLEKWRSMIFANRLLFLAFQIKSLGLHETPSAGKAYEKVTAYLGSLPYREFLLDPQVIRYSASRTTNLVYYLKFLGIADLEAGYTSAFQKVFFITGDAFLDPLTYTNKLYGMTHFIIADSNFYQNFVSAEKHAWILTYFSNHWSEILEHGNPDIIAEVAVCFKLSGKHSHPVVLQAQRFLARRFDARQGLIPSLKEDKTLEDLEHRNIMAVMALTDFPRLFPGPDLGQNPPALETKTADAGAPAVLNFTA